MARSLFADYWPSVPAFGLFAALHSIGAWEPFKAWRARWTTQGFVEYAWRFLYCVLSYVALYHGIAVLHWGWHPDASVWLVEYPDWLWQTLLVGYLLSIGLMYAAFLQSEYLEFWGLRQLWRGTKLLLGRAAPGPPRELFGTHRLVVGGVYRWVRHPMLMGGFLFLITSGPSKNNLLFVPMYGAYMLLGAYCEEQRLVRLLRRPVPAVPPRGRGLPAHTAREARARERPRGVARRGRTDRVAIRGDAVELLSTIPSSSGPFPSSRRCSARACAGGASAHSRRPVRLLRSGEEGLQLAAGG